MQNQLKAGQALPDAKLTISQARYNTSPFIKSHFFTWNWPFEFQNYFESHMMKVETSLEIRLQ